MDYNNRQTPPPFYMEDKVVAQTNTVMTKVYLRMFIGLLVTAFCSLGIASSPGAVSLIFGNRIIFWLCPIAMLVMAFAIPSAAFKMKSTVLFALFIIFSALMGIWLTPIFFAYHIGSIVSTFFITAGTFGAMAIYGHFTKTDLTKMGSYLMMGLFGLIILSIVNIFMQSSSLGWMVSIIGVLIFIGMTAYDTQQVRRMAESNLDPALSDRLATIGAMNLYLDFINLFIFLLRIFGGRNN